MRSSTLKTLALSAGIVILAAVAVVVVVATRPQPKTAAATRPQRVAVSVKEMVREPYRRSFELTGTATAIERAAVAAEAAGNVVWVSPRCEPGQAVAAGEVLMRVDPEPYAIALDRARAETARAQAALDRQEIENRIERQRLEQLESELKSAEQELARRRSLAEGGVISQSELDIQEAAYARTKSGYLAQSARVATSRALIDSARAELAARRAARDDAALDLKRTELKSPFDGVVAERQLFLGNRAAVGTTAFSVTDHSTVVVVVEIPSRRMHVVGKGVTAEVRAATDGGNGHWRRAELRHVAPAADSATRLFPAKVYLDNPGAVRSQPAPSPTAAPILPGTFVSVRLTEADPSLQHVAPFGALTYDDDGRHVFVVAEEGGEVVARRRQVEVLWRDAGSVAVSGLADGERVVVRGHESLSEGAPVELRPVL